MKKLLFTLSIALLTLTSTAQITVNVATAGEFSTALSSAGGDASTLTNLFVTGNIDARDVKFLRDNMPLLAILDLSAVQIMSYTGTDGTGIGIINYPANEMPQFSFQLKTSLTSIKLPNSINSIGELAFYESGLNGNLSIPNSVTYIKNYSFHGCSGLTGSLVIPNSVTFIGDYAFYNCYNFTDSISISNSVTSIGDYAFDNCYGFTGKLTIPNSVTSIGEHAFYNCSGLTDSLIIPNSVISIGDGAFARCSKIIFIEIDDSNPNFSAIEGVLFNKAKTELIQCPAGKVANSYIIPNSVNSIGAYAFYGCSRLTGSLNIPGSVTSIGISAFYYCTGFSGNLILPNSVTSIGEYAFEGCSGFTGSLTIPNLVTLIGYGVFRQCYSFTGSIIIPNSVTSIGHSAFDACRGFTSLSIPNSVSSINDGAFNGCSGLQKITVAQSVPLVIPDIFQGVNKTTCGLVVPTGSKSAYQAANYWKDFSNITELNNALLVHYNSLGGSSVKDTIVVLNTGIIAPIDPTKTGHTFAGWYKEETCTNIWNFATDLVTNNITLYSKWIVNNYTVSFNSQGGTAVSDITAAYSTKITNPGEPTKTGYTFAGWYEEGACINLWNFATRQVMTNTTLYARWTINTYTISFNSQGGSAVSDITALYNTKITSPGAPTKTGYNFAGWYKEAECTNAWNFATDLVTNNITLYAKWTGSQTSVTKVAASNLIMFPNPACEFIKIEGEKLKTISIYNLFGMIQKQINLHGEESININLSNLTTGYYLVKVKTNDGTVSIMKLLKN